MSNDGVNAGRRRFLVAATSVVGAAGAVGAAVPFVGSWFPSAKAKAAGAPVKVNIAKVEAGPELNRVIGRQTGDIRRDPSRLSESAMGNLVTDDDRDRAARVWRWAGRRSLALDARPPFS